MTDLAPKHAAFVTEYMRDHNGTKAAIRAGYSPRAAGSTASRLLADPAIKAEIAGRQAEVAQDSRITVASLLGEAEVARATASTAGNAAAMVAAITLKAKLTGLLVERFEDAVERDRQTAARAQIAEVRTAGRLLADAAVSLGLRPDATPAQIVGAIAERPIATPEAFALLRAIHVEEDA